MPEGYVSMSRLKLLEKRQRAGSLGGKSKSPAKQAASRRNFALARKRAIENKAGLIIVKLRAQATLE